MLDSLPEEELAMTLAFRRLVFECIPDISEKLSYNVPYYQKHKGICFIWPASILWGKKPSYTGVRFGFQQGHLLSEEDNFLEKGNRKQVFWKTFQSVNQEDLEQLRSLLYEADLIDKEAFLAKKKRTKL